MRLNQLIQFVRITPTENTDDDFKGFYLIPETTKPQDKYGKRERIDLSKPKNYPGLAATHTWNETQRVKAQIRHTKNLFDRASILFNHKITLGHKEVLKNKFTLELKNLRPHPTTLIEKYRARGESEETINLLLKNYDLLPDVKITEKQYLFLSKILEEDEDTFKKGLIF